MENNHTTTLKISTETLRRIVGTLDCIGYDLACMSVKESPYYAGHNCKQNLEIIKTKLFDIMEFLRIEGNIPEYDVRDAVSMANYGKTAAEMIIEELSK